MHQVLISFEIWRKVVVGFSITGIKIKNQGGLQGSLAVLTYPWGSQMQTCFSSDWFTADPDPQSVTITLSRQFPGIHAHEQLWHTFFLDKIKHGHKISQDIKSEILKSKFCDSKSSSCCGKTMAIKCPSQGFWRWFQPPCPPVTHTGPLGLTLHTGSRAGHP